MRHLHQLVGQLLLSLLLVTVMPAEALIKPRALPQDNRIKIVPYEPSNVVAILGSTFNTTQIIFEPGEMIENIQSGDAGAWQVDVQKQLPNIVFIKPTLAGSNTNLTIVTTKRTYYFQLNSINERQGHGTQATYAVRFVYPEEQKAKQLAQLHHQQQQQAGRLSIAKDPSTYNWSYSFHGDKRLIPLHVFDDGKFTYFELRPGQDIPAIFAVDNKAGEESVVNFRQQGRYLVVQQVAPQFTLRNGTQEVASLFNNRLIQQLSVG